MSDADGAAAWAALVGVALLGTARKPVDAGLLPPSVVAVMPGSAELGREYRGEPAQRLLDAAALLTIHRRAGATAPRPPARPGIAPDDGVVGRDVPPAAANRLADLLRGVGTNTTGMLAIWLGAAADAGFEVPPEFLPDLLDLAISRPALRDAIFRTLGSRGRWLAAHRSDWQALAGPASVPDPGTGPAMNWADDPNWTHGTTAERQAWFTRARRTDPAAARDLLADLDWPHEDGANRLAFISALATGLSDQDEPLLEQARADRRKDVRLAATSLLVRLPGSGYVTALVEQARPCLRVERVQLRRQLTVTLPGGELEFAVPKWLRDHPQASPGAVRLWYLISVVPLGTWTASLGAEPDELVSLPVSGHLADIVHNGWDDAAIRQRNASWALALMRSRDPASIGSLLLALPPPRRAGIVSAVLARNRAHPDGLSAPSLDAILRTVPPPWPPELTQALLHWLAQESQTAPIWGAFAVLARFGEHLPANPGIESQVRALARRHPVNSSWYPALAEVADTLLYRRQMLEELR